MEVRVQHQVALSFSSLGLPLHDVAQGNWLNLASIRVNIARSGLDGLVRLVRFALANLLAVNGILEHLLHPAIFVCLLRIVERSTCGAQIQWDEELLPEDITIVFLECGAEQLHALAVAELDLYFQVEFALVCLRFSVVLFSYYRRWCYFISRNDDNTVRLSVKHRLHLSLFHF